MGYVWIPRDFFSGVMAYLFGPLGNSFQESWSILFAALGNFFRSHGLFFWTPRHFFSGVQVPRFPDAGAAGTAGGIKGLLLRFPDAAAGVWRTNSPT